MAVRNPGLVVGLGFIALAAFAVLAGWAFFEGSKLGDGWRSLGPIWPYVVGGVIVVGGLAGFLMWLAFYSAKHGYDDRIDPDGP
jgi:hypothetical protein